MRRLHRTNLVEPPTWTAAVATASAPFHARAKTFEKGYALNNATRRSGFSAFANCGLPQKPNGSRYFPPLWRTFTPKIKTQFAEMSAEKCAYCESPVGSNQFGHIEHYRPKSLFPTRAYDWDNYFLACELCNHTKSDKWPVAGEYVRPDRGKPERRFVFHEDGRVDGVDASAKRAVSDWGLDRDSLREARKLVIAPRVATLQAILALPIPVNQKRQLARLQLAGGGESHSVAVNQCIRRRWNANISGLRL